MDIDKYNSFIELKRSRVNLQNLKGYYYSTLGYSNVREHILYNEPLKENDRARFDFKNLYERWQRKAVERYERLKSENRFKTKLETQIF